MKKKKTPQPSRRHTTILRQLVELIPPHLVPKLARETQVAKRVRPFTPWRHVVTMLYAHYVARPAIRVRTIIARCIFQAV